MAACVCVSILWLFHLAACIHVRCSHGDNDRIMYNGMGMWHFTYIYINVWSSLILLASPYLTHFRWWSYGARRRMEREREREPCIQFVPHCFIFILLLRSCQTIFYWMSFFFFLCSCCVWVCVKIEREIVRSKKNNNNRFIVLLVRHWILSISSRFVWLLYTL